ncbi:TonB-dependent receptor [Bacteroides sp. 51]|uniref:TonB-dependent receptor n=1 Tax=Bacteroides sp. 51 TaxID=2302938 RepID=UPI0019402DC2
MNRLCLLGGAMALLTSLPNSSLQAQSHKKDTTMNRTVVVEQQYNPDIMDAQKVNVLPTVNELTTTPGEVEYDRNVAPATVLPGTAMAAYAGEERQNLAKQGYVRVGYGNIGNLDLEGNYLFNLTAKDKLNLSLGVQGMDGKVYYPSESEKWDSRFYRTKAGIDYIHQFNTVDFNVAGNFGLSNFNFMPYFLMDHQRFTTGDVRFGVKSTDQSLPMHFNLETGLYLYSRAHNVFAPGQDDSVNETSVRTKGDFTGDIADSQQIGVAFEMNNLFYNNDEFENYTTLLLKPYYEFKEEDVWKLHLGVNVDLAFGHGKKFRVSPDVKAEYTISEGYVLYANATGGRMLNDFRRLEQFNPYGELLWQNTDSYEQLNASLGFKMSPATGFWLNVFGGYQVVKDDLYNSVEAVVVDPMSYYLYSISFPQEETKNFFVGLQANYNYKDIFNFMAKTQYHNWDSDAEYALEYKPEFRFDLQVGVRPVSALGINLGYEFIKRHTMEVDGGNYRVGNISNLNLGATYDLFDGISLYARASNLLNRKAPYYLNSPIPGINFLGGVIFSF